MADLRFDGGRQIRVDDRLRSTQTGTVPRRTVRSDESAEVPRRVEADDRRGGVEQLARGIDDGAGELVPRRDPVEGRHVPEILRQVVEHGVGERKVPAVRGLAVLDLAYLVTDASDSAPDV